ncbi:AAA family ATPase [Segatella paludivivens]|uniref:AAA family ATPase n=1 Tax=Segatella paludivivens TaxID=185294 RepID=UPI0003797F8D|nr:ATP-binding protein [Segatella paludivivens]
MIESIKIENFLSFKEEQEISFIASREKGQNPSESENWYTTIGNTKILKMLIFIGNNGAGKTNALAAIKYLRNIALHKCDNIEEKPDYEPFMLDDDSRNNPSKISIAFFINDIRYTYNISVSVDSIIEETLIMHDGRNTASVFKRQTDSKRTSIVFGNACDLCSEDKKTLTVNTLGNTSTLATFGSLNLSSAVLRSCYQYFRNEMRFVSESDFDPTELASDDDSINDPILKDILIRVFKSVDVKICDYEVTEQAIDIPKDILEVAPKSWIEQMKEKYPDGKLHKRMITFMHNTTHGNYPINVEMESKGTISMLHMIMLIFDMIKNRRSTFIDEFSYSVHQVSMDLMIRLFVALSKRSQIIITTQTVAILNSINLRRDAIRIYQKTDDGETRINIVNQALIHKNKNLYNVYMSNKLEGLPFVEKYFKFDEFIENIKNELK